MSQETLNTVLSGVAALAGVVGVFLTVWYERKRHGEREEDRRLAEEQLRLAREQSGPRLEVLQEGYWGADNRQRLPRFTVHNVGSGAVNVQDVLVVTLPEGARTTEKKITTSMCSMEREGGRELPGRLRPGDHILLDAHEGAKILERQGFSGKVETELVVRDAVEKELRYPITLHVEGKDNRGEFDSPPIELVEGLSIIM